MVDGAPDAQVVSTIDFLLTVGYIDGRLEHGEVTFIHQYLDRLIEHLGRPAGTVDALRAHAQKAYRQIEAEITALAAEVVAADDDAYLRTRLKVRAVKLFRSFTPSDQKIALELIDAVIRTDGAISPQEQDLHAELISYFHAPAALRPPRLLSPTVFGNSDLPQIDAVRTLPLELDGNPLLDGIEIPYASDPAALHRQLHADWDLVFQAITAWERQRAVGNGRLQAVSDITQLPPGTRLLDQRVHLKRPDRPTEIIVLGDLHGCYSCLKGALLQSRFVERVQAFQRDPANHPRVELVLLGDYIDRGRFGFEGVLRAALQLFVAFPDHVTLIRGNHELFIRNGTQVLSAVKPAEALPAIAKFAPNELLEAYRHLFDHMPTSLVFERILFVHGGIPREDTIAERIRDLSSLDDPVVRFEMMWGDPEQTEFVPLQLQRATPRFSFGSQQFRTFMRRVGCHTMIRGHEQIEQGFTTNFGFEDFRLHTLFSAGGRDNSDLPQDSRYRNVTPMALTIRMGPGQGTLLTPWPIQYAPFCSPQHNGLYR